ncbi:DNA-binding LacI/PurR family transcriptional regulator [Agromyces sp. 3263]|uniref:LacI family DNA-binding transcriptional regulator n=1 Tax=Agromyces sp. 3263 TaxID=2817750 RepID=UPI00285720E0|nr:LacI family DNA-binding transcriptional regulator [Agromyces sp. 3263]MDR6906573.1 DNA-binding LacI/PurR family transcriptional regulator [Agromyces sp. 3263]
MGGVTSADVARESGVSRTTVSYVLNDKAGVSVSPSTRRRVLETAARLGYAPSAAARALRSGRSDLVLCVLPDWPVGPVVETMLDHLADELAERDLSVLVHHVRGDRPLAHLWRAVTPRTVVGLAPFDPADVRAMRQAGVQVVGDDVDSAEAAALEDPQPRIGRMQAERLISRGRRRLGYATTDDRRVSDFAERRLAGVRAACVEHGLAEPLVIPVRVDPGSAASAVAAWTQADVDGVAAYNDEVAFAVLAGARDAALAVPADLAVIGVDDVPLAALASPPLTTVTQSIEHEASYLAACVLAALDGEAPPTRPHDPPTLVARESA